MMMRPIGLACLGLALLTQRAASHEAQALDPARLVGRWSGSGRFFDADLQQKVGPVSFLAEFTANGSGSGRLGGATLRDVRVKATRNRLEVTAALVGPIGADPALAKNHLALIVTALGDSTMQAEFHLKTNGAYDPRMREGRLLLRRMP